MSFFDILLGAAEIVDALSDKNTYFKITCTTLEIFELGTTWRGTARIHGAGKHLETKQVWYNTEISMPNESSNHSTKRDILRKNLREWASKTFTNGFLLPKESIVLNETENCLSCEGYAKKDGDRYIIATTPINARYYVAYKLNISKDKENLGHDELEYYFKEQTTARITSIDVQDGF